MIEKTFTPTSLLWLLRWSDTGTGLHLWMYAVLINRHGNNGKHFVDFLSWKFFYYKCQRFRARLFFRKKVQPDQPSGCRWFSVLCSTFLLIMIQSSKNWWKERGEISNTLQVCIFCFIPHFKTRFLSSPRLKIALWKTKASNFNILLPNLNFCSRVNLIIQLMKRRTSILLRVAIIGSKLFLRR